MTKSRKDRTRKLCICVNMQHIKFHFAKIKDFFFQFICDALPWTLLPHLETLRSVLLASVCVWPARAAASYSMIDDVLRLTLFSSGHLFARPDTLFMCPAAEADGGAAGGRVWRQAESLAWAKRPGVQTAERPGPGTPITLPLLTTEQSVPLLLIGKGCFWVLWRAIGFDVGLKKKKNQSTFDSTCCSGVFCLAGEPKGCGDREEAEEGPKENQSATGWRPNYAGPHEEQRPQQEGDRPAQKSSTLINLLCIKKILDHSIILATNGRNSALFHQSNTGTFLRNEEPLPLFSPEEVPLIALGVEFLGHKNCPVILYSLMFLGSTLKQQK